MIPATLGEAYYISFLRMLRREGPNQSTLAVLEKCAAAIGPERLDVLFASPEFHEAIR